MLSQINTNVRRLPDRVSGVASRYRITIAVVLLALLAWRVYSMSFNPRGDVYFPSQEYVLAQTLEHRAQVITGMKATFTRVLMGYPIGVTMGIVLGILYSEFRVFRQATMPVVIFLYSLPFVILAPLFVIWFGFGHFAIAMFVAMTTFYFVFINTLTGLTTIDEEYMHLATSTGATRFQRLFKIKLMVGMPTIASGVLVAVQQAIVSVIVAEFIVAGQGLGSILITGLSLLREGLVFGVLIIIMLFALVAYGSVKLIMERLVPGPIS